MPDFQGRLFFRYFPEYYQGSIKSVGSNHSSGQQYSSQPCQYSQYIFQSPVAVLYKAWVWVHKVGV